MVKAPDDGYRNHECEHPDHMGRVFCIECGEEMRTEEDFMSICSGSEKQRRYGTMEMIDGTKIGYRMKFE